MVTRGKLRKVLISEHSSLVAFTKYNAMLEYNKFLKTNGLYKKQNAMILFILKGFRYEFKKGFKIAYHEYSSNEAMRFAKFQLNFINGGHPITQYMR